jgi:hypothetical protein
VRPIQADEVAAKEMSSIRVMSQSFLDDWADPGLGFTARCKGLNDSSCLRAQACH